MNPTKEKIEEALKFANDISIQVGPSPARLYTYDALDILAAAYQEAIKILGKVQDDYKRDVGTNWEPND